MSSKKYPFLTREFLIEHFIKQRKSVTTIAEEFDIKSKNTLEQLIKKFGLKRSALHRSKDVISKEFLQEFYIKQNLSLSDTAKIAGFKNKSVVAKALKRFNLPIREHTLSDKVINNLSSKRSHHTICGNFFNSIKSAAYKRYIEFNITIDDIYDVYLKQNKKCAYTNIVLEFKQTSKNKNTQTASVDRIDSKKGYIEGNIQIVHKIINRMKSDLSDEEFKIWCKLVVDNDNNLF